MKVRVGFKLLDIINNCFHSVLINFLQLIQESGKVFRNIITAVATSYGETCILLQHLRILLHIIIVIQELSQLSCIHHLSEVNILWSDKRYRNLWSSKLLETFETIHETRHQGRRIPDNIAQVSE